MQLIFGAVIQWEGVSIPEPTLNPVEICQRICTALENVLKLTQMWFSFWAPKFCFLFHGKNRSLLLTVESEIVYQKKIILKEQLKKHNSFTIFPTENEGV